MDKTGFSRREWITGALALGGCAFADASFAGEPARGFFASRKLPIGLQLYTIGDAVRTDLDGALARVAKIGYRVIEPAGLHGHTPQALRDAAKKHGLKCTSFHIAAKSSPGAPGLDREMSRLATEIRTVGATDVVVSIFPAPDRLAAKAGEAFPAHVARVLPQLTVDDWKRTAALLNDKGSALRGYGLRLGYHNHNYEFAPVGGTTGLEILLKETSPDSVVFQLDVAWAAAAGVDPEALFRAHGRRFQLMHVKDLKASTPKNFALRQEPATVGTGRLKWDRLLPAAYAAGVRKFYVEQEPPFTTDPFEAITASYRYLTTVGATTAV